MQIWIDLCGYPKTSGITRRCCPDCPELCFGLDLCYYSSRRFRLCTAHRGFCFATHKKGSTARHTPTIESVPPDRHDKYGQGEACPAAAGQAPDHKTPPGTSCQDQPAHTRPPQGHHTQEPAQTHAPAHSQHRATNNLHPHKRTHPTYALPYTCAHLTLALAWLARTATAAFYPGPGGGSSKVTGPPRAWWWGLASL
jgi:hypothetical protein